MSMLFVLVCLGHTTTATWNCAVAAAGAWPRAELLFAGCSRWSTELDTVSLGSLLSALPWPKALAALTGSSAQLLTPDTVCWRTTISCCEREACWEWALQLFSCLRGVALKAATFNPAISACEKSHQWLTAQHILFAAGVRCQLGCNNQCM